MLTEIELFEYPDLTALNFCLWGWMKREGYKRKIDAPDESLARILDAAARIRKAKINSDEKHANFAHESRRCMDVTVRFSKTVDCNNIVT